METHCSILAWRIPWTEEPDGLQSMEFFRQEYYSRLPFPNPGDLPNPGIKPASLASPEEGILKRPMKTVLLSAAAWNCLS